MPTIEPTASGASQPAERWSWPARALMASAFHRPPPGKPAHLPDLVDPRWLLKALALTIAIAAICAWLTACLLFYQGAWQLVLHPSSTVNRTPADAGIPFTPVRFGDFNTGQPHLTAWWIPDPSVPDANARSSSSLTILYLHGGSGSLSDTLPALARLHNLDLHIFAVDYRGFGASDPSKHPDADRMSQDADAALDYLVTTRHIPPGDIVPMGSGLGASVAVRLAHDHAEVPAVILDNPDPDPAATAAAAYHSHIIPVRLLFGDRFALATPLAEISTPKLLVAADPIAPAPAPTSTMEDLFRHAAGPRYIVTLPPNAADRAFADALRRFLDQYLSRH